MGPYERNVVSVREIRRFDFLGGRSPVCVEVVRKDATGMIGDDVDDHLHVALVRGVYEATQLGDITKTRIERREVTRPIAVIAVFAIGTVHIGHDRRDPNRRGAKSLNVVQPMAQTAPITALVALQVARLGAHSSDEVIGTLTVVEAIHNDLIDDFVAPVVHVGRQNGPARIGRVRASCNREKQEEGAQRSQCAFCRRKTHGGRDGSSAERMPISHRSVDEVRNAQWRQCTLWQWCVLLRLFSRCL